MLEEEGQELARELAGCPKHLCWGICNFNLYYGMITNGLFQNTICSHWSIGSAGCMLQSVLHLVSGFSAKLPFWKGRIFEKKPFGKTGIASNLNLIYFYFCSVSILTFHISLRCLHSPNETLIERKHFWFLFSLCEKLSVFTSCSVQTSS